MRNELSDHEWDVIDPMLPNKPRGVPRVDERRVLNGIFWVLRSGYAVMSPRHSLIFPVVIVSPRCHQHRRRRFPSYRMVP